jgi:hypothetical protein
LIPFKGALFMLLGLEKDAKLVVHRIDGYTIWTSTYVPGKKVWESISHVREANSYQGYGKEIGFLSFFFYKYFSNKIIIGQEYVADLK